MLALAWEAVAEASPDDPGFATEALDALRLRHDWLDTHRDPDGDGLVNTLHVLSLRSLAAPAPRPGPPAAERPERGADAARRGPGDGA
jgi:hypothetical protein